MTRFNKYLTLSFVVGASLLCQRVPSAVSSPPISQRTPVATLLRTFELPSVPDSFYLVFASAMQVIFASGNNSLSTFDIQTGKIHLVRDGDQPLKGAKKIVRDEFIQALQLTPHDQFLMIVYGDGIIHLYDVKTGKERMLRGVHSSSYKAGSRSGMEDIAVSPDGQRIIAAGHSLEMWDLKAGKHVVFQKSGGRLGQLSFSPDGTRFAVAQAIETEEDNVFRIARVSVRNAATGRIEWKDALPFADRVIYEDDLPDQFSFARDGRTLVGIIDSVAYFWDGKDGKSRGQLHFGSDAIFSSAKLSRDGKLLALNANRGQDSRVRLYDTGTRTVRWVTPVYKQSQSQVVGFSSNNSLLITSTFTDENKTGKRPTTDGTRCWDTRTGHLIQTLPDESAEVLSSDGKLLLTTNYEGVKKLWQIR